MCRMNGIFDAVKIKMLEELFKKMFWSARSVPKRRNIRKN